MLTCVSFGRQLCGAAQPFGVFLTTGGISLADQFSARQGRWQRSKNLLVFLDEFIDTRRKVHALQLISKILLGVVVALSFFLFLHATHSFEGHLILPVLTTLLDLVKGIYQGSLRTRKTLECQHFWAHRQY